MPSTVTHCNTLQQSETHCSTLPHSAAHCNRHTWRCPTQGSLHHALSLCAAVCCSMMQYVAMCCSVLQCVAVYCSLLQCCSVLQCVAVWSTATSAFSDVRSALRCVAVCCSVLQCVAVCCKATSAYSSVHIVILSRNLLPHFESPPPAKFIKVNHKFLCFIFSELIAGFLLFLNEFAKWIVDSFIFAIFFLATALFLSCALWYTHSWSHSCAHSWSHWMCVPKSAHIHGVIGAHIHGVIGAHTSCRSSENRPSASWESRASASWESRATSVAGPATLRFSPV